MKVVELRLKAEESDFPIMDKKELCKYDEYFLVTKKDQNPNIFIMRYIDNIKSWYFISLDSPYSHKMELDLEDLFKRFHVYCIPEYTGGCCNSNPDKTETKKSRIQLFEFLINKYWKNKE